MTSTASLTGFNPRLSFPDLFISHNTTNGESSDNTIVGDFFEWLQTSPILVPIELSHLSSGTAAESGQSYAKFRLREEYNGRFVLLRALFEFSRPKNIIVVADANARTFEIRFRNEQQNDLLAYFELIIGRLLKEIKFKASLRMILRYESRIRQEQMKLYRSLHISMA